MASLTMVNLRQRHRCRSAEKSRQIGHGGVGRAAAGSIQEAPPVVPTQGRIRGSLGEVRDTLADPREPAGERAVANHTARRKVCIEPAGARQGVA